MTAKKKKKNTHGIGQNKKEGVAIVMSGWGVEGGNVNTSVAAFCQGNMSDLPLHLCVKRRRKTEGMRVCV